MLFLFDERDIANYQIFRAAWTLRQLLMSAFSVSPQAVASLVAAGFLFPPFLLLQAAVDTE